MKFRNFEPCFVCGEPTNFGEINYGEFFCSEECLEIIDSQFSEFLNFSKFPDFPENFTLILNDSYLNTLELNFDNCRNFDLTHIYNECKEYNEIYTNTIASIIDQFYHESLHIRNPIDIFPQFVFKIIVNNDRWLVETWENNQKVNEYVIC